MEFIKDLFAQLNPRPNNLILGGLKKIINAFVTEQQLYDILHKNDLTLFAQQINNITKGGPNSKLTQTYENYLQQIMDFFWSSNPTQQTIPTTVPIKLDYKNLSFDELQKQTQLLEKIVSDWTVEPQIDRKIASAKLLEMWDYINSNFNVKSDA